MRPMAGEFVFPSREWAEAAAKELQDDPSVRIALLDFGPVVANVEDWQF